MSKGSKRIPEKGTKYQDNWEKIFGLIPFLSARVQGLNILYRSFLLKKLKKDDNKRKKPKR